MDREMILAAVGIGITIGLLGFLAIYQQIRAGRQKEGKTQALRAAAKGQGELPPGTVAYFIACFRGHNARFFRAYPDANGLHFLYAGPYFVLIDADAPRGGDRSHWMLRSRKMLCVTLASAFVAAAVVGFVIARAFSQQGIAASGGFGHFVVVLIGMLGLLSLVAAIVTPSVLWQITRRGNELDALPLSGLREQIELDEKSFRAGPENVAELTVSLLNQDQHFRPEDEIGCVLSFQHVPTGRWKIETLTSQDTRDAIEASLGVWKGKQVQIEPQLLDRLAEQVSADKQAAARIGPALQPLLVAAEERLRIQKELEANRPPEIPVVIAGSTWSMNGCGTMVCEARGIVKWVRYPEDCDAILAFCLVGIPLVPYAAVHTSDWEFDKSPNSLGGWHYRSFPIRWSWDLVAAAYLVRMGIALVVIGLLTIVVAYYGVVQVLALPEPEAAQWEWIDGLPFRLLAGGVGLAIAAYAVFARWQWGLAERRHRSIRLVLGRHLFGSSDPLFWRDEMQQRVRPPKQVFAARTFGEAAEALLTKEEPVPAMFAARLCAALEDRQRGEQLTDAILENPAVKAALDPMRRQPACRGKVLPGSEWEAAKLFLN